MTAERDALADEQAYGIATKVMAGWPVPTISMYAALVRAGYRAGYRAALAAPARCIIAACPDDPVRIGLCAHHLALIEGQAAQPDNDQSGGAGIPSSSALGNNRSALPPDPTAAPAQGEPKCTRCDDTGCPICDPEWAQHQAPARAGK